MPSHTYENDQTPGQWWHPCSRSWECKGVLTPWETVQWFLTKLNILLLYNYQLYFLVPNQKSWKLLVWLFNISERPIIKVWFPARGTPGRWENLQPNPDTMSENKHFLLLIYSPHEFCTGNRKLTWFMSTTIAKHLMCMYTAVTQGEAWIHYANELVTRL